MFNPIYPLLGNMKYIHYKDLYSKCRSSNYIPYDTLDKAGMHSLKYGVTGLTLGAL